VARIDRESRRVVDGRCESGRGPASGGNAQDVPATAAAGLRPVDLGLADDDVVPAVRGATRCGERDEALTRGAGSRARRRSARRGATVGAAAARTGATDRDGAYGNQCSQPEERQAHDDDDSPVGMPALDWRRGFRPLCRSLPAMTPNAVPARRGAQ
jgi:hypothetical protein